MNPLFIISFSSVDKSLAAALAPSLRDLRLFVLS